MILVLRTYLSIIMRGNMNNFLRFRITFQTIKDHQRVTIIITLLFIAMAAMYCGMYPAFKDVLADMAESGS